MTMYVCFMYTYTFIFFTHFTCSFCNHHVSLLELRNMIAFCLSHLSEGVFKEVRDGYFNSRARKILALCVILSCHSLYIW